MRVRFVRSGVNDNDFSRVILQIQVDIGGVRLESQFRVEVKLGNFRLLGRNGDNS